MRIPLTSPARKIPLVLASALLLAGYLFLAGREFGGAYFSGRPDLASLQRAVRWQPGNADYRHRLGRYFFLIQRAPEAAVESFRAGVGLNPYQARYWFDLAGAYQLLGDTDAQKAALERGLVVDTSTPDLAWEAANFYLVQGDTDKALREFHVVMESDPSLPTPAVKQCWRVKPDVDLLLRDVVPPNIYPTFLDLLISEKQTAPAAKVWTKIAEVRLPVPPQLVFAYIRYLVGQHEVDQARVVWQQASTLSGLSAYQPSSGNLVINGDFSLNVLNGGFDWQYRQSKEVSLALDPTQSHGGHRSLLITFDAQKISDAGIAQLVPVNPSTAYDFSAYFKADDIRGAGGPQFALQDLYTETTYFASDDLKDADFWKEVSGTFTTGLDTKLLLLHIQRFPAGDPIKGKLWIDSVRLVGHEQGPELGQ